MIQRIGKATYDENMATMQELYKKELDDPLADFQAIEGDIDLRAEKAKDLQLSDGFET